MSRWKAAGIHLSISLAIGLLVGALLFGVWYPPPYFHAAGADELILLLVGIDIVLGPLMTLVIFRSGKRGLKFDLTVIGLVQAAALVYGLSIVLQSRPVFLVGAIDRFTLVSAGDIEDSDLQKGRQPLFRSPTTVSSSTWRSVTSSAGLSNFELVSKSRTNVKPSTPLFSNCSNMSLGRSPLM